MSFTDVLFKPNGRISAGQFWGGWAVIVVGNIIANFIPLLGLLISLALIYVGCCVYGKRLHDMGRSAWLHAIPWVVTIVLGIVAIMMMVPAVMEVMEADPEAMNDPQVMAEIMASAGPAMGIFGLNFLIWLGYTIWVGVGASDPGENQYGPPTGASVQPTFE